MARDYKREEEKELIKRFDDYLNNKKFTFFELEDFIFIIDHYLQAGKLNKALKTCNLGIDQYPFSVDLLLDKAQILVNIEEYEEALQYLEKADNLQPNDIEILLLKANVLSISG